MDDELSGLSGRVDRDRIADAIAGHVWAIASYIDELRLTPALQRRIAGHIGESVMMAVSALNMASGLPADDI